VHRAIGLPADAQNPALIPLQSQPGGTNGIGQLRGGVTPEVTYAGSVLINRLGQFQGIDPTLPCCRVTIVPVLTEQAIKGASLIENGQILIAIFSSTRVGKAGITSPGSTGTDPIGDTISRQGIIIPADVALAGGGTFKPIFLVGAQPAIAPAV